ncbi:MAG: hypothetical protein ACLFWD_03760 [Anaerolineales bacterium]
MQLKLDKRFLWIGVAFIPTVIFFVLRTNPTFDIFLEAQLFHFYIVTFTSFAALVSALIVASAVENENNPHILFLTMGYAATAGFFLLHGLATPGIVVQGFNQAVGWSARLSLFTGAVFLL